MIKKIDDIKPWKQGSGQTKWSQPCMNPGHNFPNMIVLPDGVYEHTCPSCGQKQTVTIMSPTYSARSSFIDVKLH